MGAHGGPKGPMHSTARIEITRVTRGPHFLVILVYLCSSTVGEAAGPGAGHPPADVVGTALRQAGPADPPYIPAGLGFRV